MSNLIKIFVLMLIFSAVSFAQWKSIRVHQNETATSDSFHVPSSDYYLSGLFYPDTAGTHIGNASRNKVYFWVSNNPKTEGWQKLSYDGALFYVDVTSLAITIKPQATYSWEWYKVFYGAAVKDSVYFYPQFTKMK